MSTEQPKLYTELAGWWQLVSPTEHYADEAAFFAKLFRAGNAGTVLELGSGGGNVAWFLKKDFALTLTDLSGAMLAESKKQNPELEHIEGDMRTLRLGRTFDGVLIHDAIMYMTSEQDLRAALLTAYEHCKPGGVAVIVPDFVAETFKPTTEHEGQDAGGRSVRYLEWTWDADPGDTEVNYEFVLALREGDGLRVVVDRQILGVFPRETWLRLLREVGFEAEVVEDPSGEGEREEVFVAHKPSLPGG
ncbi:MAG: class I SAM-dependent methyltransferase [Rubrobacteraceae bacterium]|nr:class I SAM-dependent methyltransferase [Rubrobacteraceae bacterium]